MDDGRFDAMVRVLGSDAPRRRVLAGLLPACPLCSLGKTQLPRESAIRKRRSRPNRRVRGRRTAQGRIAVDNGCGGVCGACAGNDTCTAQGLCVCEPDCAGK